MRQAATWRCAGLTVAIALGMLAGAQAAAPSEHIRFADDNDGRDWTAWGRSFSEQRFSPLDQINRDSVSRLGLAWSLDFDGIWNVSSQPLAVDGVIYTAVGYSHVHAIDAVSGEVLWQYDPKVSSRKMRMAWGSRGLAYWDGKLYTGVQDGRLFALDAKTGELLWETLTTEPGDNRYITGAPRVFNGKVIIGHGGADFGHVRGYVTTYDAITGEPLWRWWVVPGNPADGFENEAMEAAAKTWTGNWWEFGGGGTVWNAMTYDPEYNRIYLGTGNGSPWNHKLRSPDGGDNLFLCSVVALDADTGEYVWHYQTTPGETWDFTSTMDMVLADVRLGNRDRKVLMHAPKNGFFYVLDREDGTLISAEKIDKVTWAERVDLETGRPVEVRGARYESGEALIWPGSGGAHNWHPMAYSPDTGLVYIPAPHGGLLQRRRPYAAELANDPGRCARSAGILRRRSQKRGQHIAAGMESSHSDRGLAQSDPRRDGRRCDRDPGWPGISRPGGRLFRRHRRRHRRGAVALFHGSGHAGSAHDLRGRWRAVRHPACGLGRRAGTAGFALRATRLGRTPVSATNADLCLGWHGDTTAVTATHRQGHPH